LVVGVEFALKKLMLCKDPPKDAAPSDIAQTAINTLSKKSIQIPVFLTMALKIWTSVSPGVVQKASEAEADTPA